MACRLSLSNARRLFLPTLVVGLVLTATAGHGEVLYNGMVYSGGEWSSPDQTLSSLSSDQSLQAVAQTGATHIRLLVTWYQDYVNSTQIYPINGSSPLRTVTDDDLTHAINTSHSLGLKVAMAPILDPNWDLPTNLRSFPGYKGAECILNGSKTCPGWSTSRLVIGCAQNSPPLSMKCARFNNNQWAAWFASYGAFILHYAKLAESQGVDLFMVGSELDISFEQGDHWEDLVKAVRAVFSGKLTVAVNIGTGMNMTWWDKVDYLGCEGYDPLHPDNETLEGFVAAWEPLIAKRAALVKKWNMSLMFTEHGYQSRPHCWKRPYATVRPNSEDCSVWPLCYDMQCQATLYEAFFTVTSKLPWYVGSFWWLWRSDATAGGTSDNSFTPRGKPAEQVLKKWFANATNRRTNNDESTGETIRAKNAEGSARHAANSTTSYQHSMIFAAGQWSYHGVRLDSSEAFNSIQQCSLTTGVNMLQYVPTHYYNNASSTDFYSKGDDSPLRTTTAAELSNTIQFAASLALDATIAVVLEPDYDLGTNFDSTGAFNGTPHQHLGENFTSAELQEWFMNYKALVVEFATLAEKNHVQSLLLGHELNAIVSHNASAPLWSDLITAARKVYSGLVSVTLDGSGIMEDVAANRVPWLKELDFIGLSCYWQVPGAGGLLPVNNWLLPAIENLTAAYIVTVDELQRLSASHGNMSVVCTDVGYQSRPYAWNHRLSGTQLDGSDCSVWDQCMSHEGQALAYSAFLQAVKGRPWFGGAHWWLWRSDLSAGGHSDDSYTPAQKPAADVLREFAPPRQ